MIQNDLIIIDGVSYDPLKIDSTHSVWKILTDGEKKFSIQKRSIEYKLKRDSEKVDVTCQECQKKCVSTVGTLRKDRWGITYVCNECRSKMVDEVYKKLTKYRNMKKVAGKWYWENRYRK